MKKFFFLFLLFALFSNNIYSQALTKAFATLEQNKATKADKMFTKQVTKHQELTAAKYGQALAKIHPKNKNVDSVLAYKILWNLYSGKNKHDKKEFIFNTITYNFDTAAIHKMMYDIAYGLLSRAVKSRKDKDFKLVIRECKGCENVRDTAKILLSEVIFDRIKNKKEFKVFMDFMREHPYSTRIAAADSLCKHYFTIAKNQAFNTAYFPALYHFKYFPEYYNHKLFIEDAYRKVEYKYSEKFSKGWEDYKKYYTPEDDSTWRACYRVHSVFCWWGYGYYRCIADDMNYIVTHFTPSFVAWDCLTALMGYLIENQKIEYAIELCDKYQTAYTHPYCSRYMADMWEMLHKYKPELKWKEIDTAINNVGPLIFDIRFSADEDQVAVNAMESYKDRENMHFFFKDEKNNYQLDTSKSFKKLTYTLDQTIKYSNSIVTGMSLDGNSFSYFGLAPFPYLYQPFNVEHKDDRYYNRRPGELRKYNDYFSYDGNTKFFVDRGDLTSELPDSINFYHRGNADIWFIRRDENGKWSELQKLPHNINGPAIELQPYLAADNKTLYFQTDSRGHFGRFDIYVTRRLDDTWQNWTDPVHIGTQINDGCGNWSFQLNAQGTKAYKSKQMNDTTVKIVEYDISGLDREFKPDSIVVFRGIAQNENDSLLKQKYTIEFFNLETGNHYCSIKGNDRTHKYTAALPGEFNYGYYIKSKGYFCEAFNKDFSEKKRNMTINQNFKLVPLSDILENEKVARFNNVFFDMDDSLMTIKSRPELKRMVSLINTDTSKNVEIILHSLVANYKTKLRIESIKHNLNKLGVDPERLLFTIKRDKNAVVELKLFNKKA